LKKPGLPQYVRDDINSAGTEYWKNFKKPSFCAPQTQARY
jgi:hypothetical protein